MPWNSDYSSADTLRCKLHDADYKFNRYTELVEAVNERCDGVGIATLDAPVRLDIWTDIRIAVQSKIDTLIPLYANHTDNGGNWNNQATIPAWTEANLLTAISASRIPAAISCDIPAWLNQQYQILNLLRWTKNWILTTRTAPFFEYYKQKSASNSAWITCVANFNAASFGSPFPNSDIGHEAYNAGGFTPYNIIRRAWLYTQTNNTGFDIDFQVYFYFRKITTGGGYTVIFENNDYPVSENTFYRTEDTSIINAGSYDYDMGLITNNSMTEPSFLQYKEWRVRATNSGSVPSIEPVIIAKFDVTNGFTYKDW